jgi:hypothetical protein
MRLGALLVLWFKQLSFNGDNYMMVPNRQDPAQAEAVKQFGMGDVVASATKAVGIKPCAPCAKRQAALNKATPGWVAKILGWFKR